MASKSYTNSIKSDAGQKMWPDNLVSAYDHLQIDVEDYKASKVRGQGRSSNSRSSVRAVGSGGSTLSSSSSRFGNSLENFIGFKSVIDDTVLLPVPDDIQYKDGPKWEGKDIGILGRFFCNLLSTFFILSLSLIFVSSMLKQNSPFFFVYSCPQ